MFMFTLLVHALHNLMLECNHYLYLSTHERKEQYLDIIFHCACFLSWSPGKKNSYILLQTCSPISEQSELT